MTTPTDTDDPPPPDSRSALLANKPERCNTKIIDPALLADIVPQAPPESRRPGSESGLHSGPGAPAHGLRARTRGGARRRDEEPRRGPAVPNPAHGQDNGRRVCADTRSQPAKDSASCRAPRRRARSSALRHGLGSSRLRRKHPGAAPAQPEEKVTPSVPPPPTHSPSAPAVSGARSSAPPASTPGTRPTARPATTTTSSHAPAAPSTTTMVFPSD